jgi:DNA-directed RNA polymerase specialized sigma24 family protein
VQDAFLNAKRGFSEFRGENEKELVGWLRSILANQLSGLVRRYHTEKRNVTQEVNLDLENSSHALVESLRFHQSSPSEHAPLGFFLTKDLRQRPGHHVQI